MHELDETKFGPMTKAIHCGTEGKESTHGPVNTPIYASSTFAYPTVEEGAARFSGDQDGFVYSRLGNPTVKDVETRLAKIEGTEAGLLLGSGMAAVTTAVTTVVQHGDHVIADKTLYGGTHSLFTHKLPAMGVEVSFVDASDPLNVINQLRDNTKVLYFETPTNPTLRLVPVKEMAKIGMENGIMTMIDSTFTSPILMRPKAMGIDVVIHSATKYLNGHSDLIAGVILGDQEFIDECRSTSVHFGGILGPFEAFLLGRGLKTLRIRIEEHERNGKIMADYLRDHPLVKNLKYLGHPSHPQYELAKEQQDGFGSMMTFELDGTFEMAKIFVNALELATRAVSLGGVETLISHPASTTHAIIEEEDRLNAGVTDTLMRLSVGLEESKDLIADFDNAFSKVVAYKQANSREMLQ